MVIWLLSFRAVFRKESCIFCSGLFSICRSISCVACMETVEKHLVALPCHCSFLRPARQKSDVSRQRQQSAVSRQPSVVSSQPNLFTAKDAKVTKEEGNLVQFSF